MNWLDKKDILETLILREHKSYEEIGRLYNCSGAAIKKAARRLGIELPNRRAINPSETFNRGTIRIPIIKCKNCGKEFKKYSSHTGKYCSIECQHEYEHQIAWVNFQTGDWDKMRANYQPSIFKKDILREQGGVCAICGCEPIHNGKPLTFVLDHIDGHASHNMRFNLRCICPNCDSQLDTYKSKNKNGERNYYRYHKGE